MPLWRRREKILEVSLFFFSVFLLFFFFCSLLCNFCLSIKTSTKISWKLQKLNPFCFLKFSEGRKIAYTAWKVSKYGVFPGPYSVRMRENIGVKRVNPISRGLFQSLLSMGGGGRGSYWQLFITTFWLNGKW